MTRWPAAPRPTLIAGIAAVILGVLASWAFSWTCDDAFISFRYAWNFARGLGLVFNEGERVEGYTNFAWTVWAALGLRLGADVEVWAIGWGIVCYAISIALLVVHHLHLRSALEVSVLTFPAAALLAAGHDEWNIWATGGLETSAFTMLAIAGYVVVARHLVDGQHRPIIAGLIFAVATLTRPDGVVFAFVGALLLLATARSRWRATAAYALAFSAVFGPFLAWRLAYYGDLFPNTYYAKSAAVPWFEQGWHYILLYTRKYWALFATLPLAAWAVFRARPPAATARAWLWHALAALLFAGAYGFYVARIGGDFMFARMLIPATPFLLVLLELGIIGLSCVRPLAGALALAVVIVACRLTPPPVSGEHWDRGVANEWMVYSPWVRDETMLYAEVLDRYLGDTGVRYAFLGGEARVMYYADLPVAIESETGLTDRTVARQPLARRGRVGHEKRASVEYLVRERKAHLTLHPQADAKLPLDEWLPRADLFLGPMRGRLLHWDPALMAELERRGATFTRYPEYLDDYLARIEQIPTEQVEADFDRFRLFYFEHVDDSIREQRFRAHMSR